MKFIYYMPEFVSVNKVTVLCGYSVFTFSVCMCVCLCVLVCVCLPVVGVAVTFLLVQKVECAGWQATLNGASEKHCAAL